MKYLISLLLLIASSSTLALTFPEKYIGGQEACLQSRHLIKQYSFRVNVPADYKDSSKGLTSIYAWTQKPFDPNKNTMVFFTGGPGNIAHGIEFELANWNLVYFDMRGNSCSRPEKQELFEDPDFYSSHYVVYDVEAIRRYLKAEKISVYGVSYGTVPAHLYAHHFPHSTRSVVLEGVIFDGGRALIEPSNRIINLQKFFNSLSTEEQQKVLEFSRHPQISPVWFAQVGSNMLYYDRPFDAFKRFLDIVLQNLDSAIPLLESFDKSTDPVDIAFGYGYMFMAMIGCQELGITDGSLSSFAIFQGRILVPDRKNILKEQYCDWNRDFNIQTYSAANYPSKVPTFYIQGVLDGATGYINALNHFDLAVSGSQLLLAEEGGHMPLHGGLNSGYETAAIAKVKLRILEQLLSGNPILEKDIADIEEVHSLGWTLRSK